MRALSFDEIASSSARTTLAKAIFRPAVYLHVACPITLTRSRQEIHHQLMMARLVATPLPASFGVGATHVPLACSTAPRRRFE
jgi:hypothetical protein